MATPAARESAERNGYSTDAESHLDSLVRKERTDAGNAHQKGRPDAVQRAERRGDDTDAVGIRCLRSEPATGRGAGERRHNQSSSER